MEDIFLINFAVNFIILIIVKKILKSPKKMYRLVISAGIGGIYTIIYYFFDWNYTIGKILASMLMTFLAFGWTNILQFIKKYLSFHLITYAFGGAVYGLVSLLGVAGASFPIKTFLFAICFAFVVISIASATLEKRKKIEKNIIPLLIGNSGKEVTIPCLQDTGNETGVIVAELGAVRDILPKEFCQNLSKIDNPIDIFEKWSQELRLKIVPFNSLGSSGVLIGFTPEKNSLDKNVVAIYNGKLTSTEMYRAIA